jgi:adenine-specific DNA-methyltransferase
MARLDDLVAQVADPSLRREMEAALGEMKRRQRFGLVFEQHIPETTVLHGLPIQAGSLVQRRDDPQAKVYWRVTATTPQEQATVEPSNGGEPEQVPVGDLLAVKRFGEPMYPALTPLGSVRRGRDDKPHHAVINGENFHALQLLAYQFEGQVDCIYLDPPYNTGTRDWKYNNRYVDDSDAWRHSKWLSMMEKRLRLAKRLLKPDGVLIVTIDEHEVHHLGMLLESLYPRYQQTLVTIVNNPKGTGAANFSRVGEYAIFVCPQDAEVIRKVPFGFGMPIKVAPRDHRVVELFGEDSERLVRKLALRRDGAESSNRVDRPWQLYAIYIDEETGTVTGIGEELAVSDTFPRERRDGNVPVYPIDARGRHRVWRYGRDTMTRLIEQGEIVVTGRNRKTGTYSLYHYKSVAREDAERRRPRTVWWHSSHDAGAHGASLLNDFLGQRSLFPFPKSVFAVADCLRLVTEARPNALIVDAFAGSGTTFHATCLLNSEDGGTADAC